MYKHAVQQRLTKSEITLITFREKGRLRKCEGRREIPGYEMRG